ncbi:hypothetical protein PAPYR_8196 [Paratrimastix pyriformis]|uniref:RING-type domain-containing protein n=1 Tax=Paratrimastix pyriformis TaxID=342808 RepID=A0ABQ8UB70_9EUKA|nr:hypothetical protein PAPYR_8196 [Paratrimastix pyriformis]
MEEEMHDSVKGIRRAVAQLDTEVKRNMAQHQANIAIAAIKSISMAHITAHDHYRPLLARSQEELVMTRQDLAQCQEALATTRQELTVSKATADHRQAQLTQCQEQLAQCQEQLAQCQEHLAKSVQELGACRAQLSGQEKQLDYIFSAIGDDQSWRCPACHAHYEDPVSLSCGDTVCRACAAAVGETCPVCKGKFAREQLFPSRIAERQVKLMRCSCPNKPLGCPALLGVLDVEHHLGAECEWREEECDQCHQRVRRAQMGRHKDTTCACKPMACGYAGLGCEARCPQGDLAAHERDGVVAHVGLLMQRLAATSADLAQTRAQLARYEQELILTRAEMGDRLASSQADLTQTRQELAGCMAELAQTKERTQRQMDALRWHLEQLVTPPPSPEGLEAVWDGAAKQVALSWPAIPALAAAPGAAALPVRYRVQATVMAGQGDDANTSTTTTTTASITTTTTTTTTSMVIVYTGPECRCRYDFPPAGCPERVEVRFVVVAMRGLAESEPTATATCIRPAEIPSAPLALPLC